MLMKQQPNMSSDDNDNNADDEGDNNIISLYKPKSLRSFKKISTELKTSRNRQFQTTDVNTIWHVYIPNMVICGIYSTHAYEKEL